jgi:hypothetical protein
MAAIQEPVAGAPVRLNLSIGGPGSLSVERGEESYLGLEADQRNGEVSRPLLKPGAVRDQS